MIKNVYIKKNIDLLNEKHKIGAFRKKGILVIEDTNGKEHLLDLETMSDITDTDYLTIKETKRTKKKYIFKNIMYDTETLEILARR